MKRIATLNKISPTGLDVLSDAYTMIDEPADADAIIVRSANMHEMEFGDRLLAIARAGAGFNNIPIERCADEGIVVFNTPGANANAVKELVICALLMGARNVPEAINWEAAQETEGILKTAEKGKGQFAGTEIKGKTLGVIGLGAIGVLVANCALSLGMNVIGYDPYITLKAAHNLSNAIPIQKELGAMLKKCDFITVHVPVTETTEYMFDSRRFGQMKDGAVLLNFARDTLVRDEAVIEALENGKLSKYVTDFATEKIHNHEKVIALPHLGASTQEAEDNCAAMAAEQLMDFLDNGNITNSVNYPMCNMGSLSKSCCARVCVMHKNIPSMIGNITGKMAELNINISDMLNKSRGEYAYTMLDIDSEISMQDVDELSAMDGIIRVRVIK